ncbi:Uncharacterised protein [Burkholderia pseudomallei]|nr:Uncharacterised protein [Burkholderia pseudomallei]CAJ5291201.1 Uncharacterised protein [Burkholderia pseudomallei]CAJ6689134.1 Uncharacterised protein [Burkholderia pseudomallei]CAJ8125240.1 Uncharacterised protein [Burkholderia pseudomallei]CAJ8607141.1 Uncharacterised protein [Burkholderia pseudomallei]
MPDANMRDERRGDGGRPVPADGRCARANARTRR